MNTPTNAMEGLPFELWCRVASWMPSLADLAVFALTCRTALAIASDRAIRRTVARRLVGHVADFWLDGLVRLARIRARMRRALGKRVSDRRWSPSSPRETVYVTRTLASEDCGLRASAEYLFGRYDGVLEFPRPLTSGGVWGFIPHGRVKKCDGHRLISVGSRLEWPRYCDHAVFTGGNAEIDPEGIDAVVAEYGSYDYYIFREARHRSGEPRYHFVPARFPDAHAQSCRLFPSRTEEAVSRFP